MDVDKLMSFASQYGVPTAILCWVLKWVFDTSKRREESLATIINSGMASLTTSINDLSKNIQANTLLIQEVARNMKDGFDAVHKAGDFQRAEHKELMTAIQDGEKTAETAREKIVGAIEKRECKAPNGK